MLQPLLGDPFLLKTTNGVPPGGYPIFQKAGRGGFRSIRVQRLGD
jgi:hypothetical protein